MKIFYRLYNNTITISLLLLIIPFYVYGQDPDSSKNNSWFSVNKIAEKVWCIDDHGGDNMYLVEGDDKAMLIDAGTGMADLSACVKSITKLPIIVVNTHGHPDHCGSDFQFSEVFAHQSDFEAIVFFCSENYRKGEIERTIKQSPELSGFIMSDVKNFKLPKLIPVKQGHIFDLGDRKLEVIEVPGHTKGSICLLDADNKLIFTGDNNNTLVWLFLDGCLPLESYIQTLRDLKQRSNEFSVILPGHGDPLDKEFIDDQILCGEKILSGECKGEPYKTFVDYAKVCSHKRARIAFNPDNLFEKK